VGSFPLSNLGGKKRGDRLTSSNLRGGKEGGKSQNLLRRRKWKKRDHRVLPLSIELLQGGGGGGGGRRKGKAAGASSNLSAPSAPRGGGGGQPSVFVSYTSSYDLEKKEKKKEEKE